MATDFHFVPPHPEALSGPSMLSQIEIAINELGGSSDDVRAIAEEALATANEALSEAASANQAASDAQATANQADQKAQQAIDLANGFDTRITDARNRADAAYDLAAQADSNASAADTKAQQALDTANAAQETAETAQDTAEQAQQTADLALKGVDSIGVYKENSTEDADANFYTFAVKRYLTNTATINIPSDLSIPIFLDVETNRLEDGTTTEVIQKAFSALSPGDAYTRTGTTDNTDPENPVTTWGPWESIGNGSTDQTALKNAVLGALTNTNPNADWQQALGYNGRIITTVNVPNTPDGESGAAAFEFISDSTQTNTLVQYVNGATKNLYYSNTSSDVLLGAGQNFYRITATSGATELHDTLVFRCDASGNLFLTPQVGSPFSITETSTSGLIVAGKLDFYSDNTVFREDGFTLTIQQESGGSPVPGGIEISFPAYGSGEPTIVEGTVTGTLSYVRFLSGQQLNAGGSEAEIYISATWTSFTGSVEWSDWVQPGKVNYSAAPHLTGQTWVDGSSIYQVTVDCGALPNATIKNVPHGLTIARLIKAEGIAQTAAADSFLVLPHVGALADGGFNIQVDIDATNITIQTSSNESAYAEAYVTLTYTQA